MISSQNSDPPPGWIGGFAQSNPAFAYDSWPDDPNHPDLTSLDMLANMASIDLLQRQQGVKWPEFSWLSVPGDEESRCFQMFSPYISRLGYTDTGRIYSIICPQQGACSPSLGCMNIEVTVTGQRGWVDETTRELAADMTVHGTIWFSPSAHEKPLVKLLWLIFKNNGLPFPSTKKNGINVSTHRFNEHAQPIFPVRKGETNQFPSPPFARHPEAWTVGHVEVQIGPIAKTGVAIVDEFNELVMDLFNLSSGNILLAGNLLTWNTWFTTPGLVDRDEWKNHAEMWRDSIDADHGSPTGPGTTAKYFDGTPFKPVEALIDEEVRKILAYLEKHL